MMTTGSLFKPQRGLFGVAAELGMRNRGKAGGANTLKLQDWPADAKSKGVGALREMLLEIRVLNLL
jgi:hypothetical protein